MNLARTFTLFWLGGLGLLGLTVVGMHFGAEYGVLYFFTIFPLALFIQTTIDPTNRRRRMALFTWTVGSLSGYCTFKLIDFSFGNTLSSVFSVMISLILHVIFDRVLKLIARQSEEI